MLSLLCTYFPYNIFVIGCVILPHNRPFPSCSQPHYENEAKCKVFVMKNFKGKSPGNEVGSELALSKCKAV